MLGPLKLFAVLFAACAAMPAQTTETCKDRSAIVNALDEHGGPVKDPKGARFKASRRTKPMKIASVQYRRDASGRVAVFLDTSESMKGKLEDGTVKWEVARTAVLEFASGAPVQNQVSFMTFSNGVYKNFDASSGRELIKTWLDDADVRKGKALGGRPVLYDSILEALKTFGPSQPGEPYT
jgi:hypothetical protein